LQPPEWRRTSVRLRVRNDDGVSQWDPDSYRPVNTLQQLVAERALADLVLEGDERVLDVGCGDENVAPFSRSKATGFEIG
jgi:hypothetical protein